MKSASKWNKIKENYSNKINFLEQQKQELLNTQSPSNSCDPYTEITITISQKNLNSENGNNQEVFFSCEDLPPSDYTKRSCGRCNEAIKIIQQYKENLNQNFGSDKKNDTKKPGKQRKCAKCNDIGGEQLPKVLPIIDDLLDEFCNCCNEVQTIFSPLTSPKNENSKYDMSNKQKIPKYEQKMSTSLDQYNTFDVSNTKKESDIADKAYYEYKKCPNNEFINGHKFDYGEENIKYSDIQKNYRNCNQRMSTKLEKTNTRLNNNEQNSFAKFEEFTNDPSNRTRYEDKYISKICNPEECCSFCRSRKHNQKMNNQQGGFSSESPMINNNDDFFKYKKKSSNHPVDCICTECLNNMIDRHKNMNEVSESTNGLMYNELTDEDSNDSLTSEEIKIMQEIISMHEKHKALRCVVCSMRKKINNEDIC